MNDDVERTNELLGRLGRLQDAVENGKSFRSMIEIAHERKMSLPTPQHLSGAVTVRAGLIRGLVGSVCAALDPPNGDRASIGQILKSLNDSPEILTKLRLRDRSQTPEKQIIELEKITKRYNEFVAKDEYKKVKNLRHTSVAHVLMKDIEKVPYDLIYSAHTECEQLTVELFAFCRSGIPTFKTDGDRREKDAQLFWDTYLKGLK